MSTNDGQLVKLATSAQGKVTLDENINSVFNESYNELYGLSILQIVMDPENNETSQFLGTLLEHGFANSYSTKETNFCINEFEKQSEQVWDKDQPPALVTWSKPIIIEKGAGKKVGYFILDIVGNFHRGILDPNFIALGGLGVVMSSTVLSVTIGDLNLSSLENILRPVIQGLRSRKLRKLQQLYFLFVNDSKNGVEYCNKTLADFFANKVDNQSIQRLRYAFKEQNCSWLPKGKNPRYNSYLSQFIGDVLDDYLQIKINDAGSHLKGCDLIDLMQTHEEIVYNAAWESFFPILDKLINSALTPFKSCTPNRENCFDTSIKIESDDDSDNLKISEDYSEEKISSTEVLGNQDPDETDSLTERFSNLGINDKLQFPKVGSASRKKFSDRHSLDFINSVANEEIVPEKSTLNPISVDNVDVYKHSFEVGKLENNGQCYAMSKCTTQTVNDIPSINSLSEQTGIAIPPKPLKKSKISQLEGKKFDAIFYDSTPTILTHVPGEIVHQENSQVDYQNFMAKFNAQTIIYLNQISPISEITAEHIVETSKENTLELIPAMRGNKSLISVCTGAVNLTVVTLINIVKSFQNEVEQQCKFTLSTNDQIDKIKAKYLTSNLTLSLEENEGYIEALKIKLDTLSDEYIEVCKNNEKIIKETANDVAENIKDFYIKMLTGKIEMMDRLDNSKLTKIHSDLKSYTKVSIVKIMAIGENITILADVQNTLDQNIETEYINQVELARKRFDEEIKTLEISADRALKDYESKIKDPKLFTMGMLETSHKKITSDAFKQFDSLIKGIPNHRRGSFKSKLEANIEDLYKNVSKERKSALSPKPYASNFVPPVNSWSTSKTSNGQSMPTLKAGNNKLALGIHFGTSKLAVCSWRISSKTIIPPIDNKLIYTDYEFELSDTDKNGYTIDTGNFFNNVDKFEFEYQFPCSKTSEKLKYLSLLAILFSRIKRKAESISENKVSIAVIAIPSFLGQFFANHIKLACKLIDLQCEVISETDGVAIQQIGKIGIKDSANTTSAAVVAVIRQSSCDIASYIVENGQIRRKALKCIPKSYFEKIVESVSSNLHKIIFSQLSDHCKKIAEAIPSDYRNKLSIVVVSDAKMPDSTRENLKFLDGLGGTIHVLGSCASKGAAFLGGYNLDSKSAKEQWGKYNDKFVLSQKSSIIEGNFSPREGIFCKEINFESGFELKIIKENLEKVMASTNQDTENAKKELKFFFENTKLEIKQNQNEGYIERKMIQLIEDGLDLLNSIDADVAFCIKKQSEVVKKIEELQLK